MSEDATHRLTGQLRRNGRVYDAGEALTPTEAELAAFPDRFEPVDTEQDDADAADAEDDSEHPAPEAFTEIPVKEYRSYVREHELSIDRLHAMLDAEQEREETRSTVVSLLEDALSATAE